MSAPPLTLEQVHDPAAGESFPRAELEGCEDALALFAAGFYGRQDAYWLHDAGLAATCVDLDGERLRAMRDLYPDTWDFVHAEVFEWAAYVAAAELTWDVVTVDCPTGSFQRCATLLPQWCALARELVVLGTGTDTELEPPAGWVVTDWRQRSTFAGGVYWAVLEPS